MCRDDDTGVDTVELGEGIEYLMKLLDLRGIGEKLMTDLTSYWWILLLALILAMLLSFLWIGQFHYLNSFYRVYPESFTIYTAHT